MTQYALASDLGGTHLRVGLVDRDGNVVHRNSVLAEAFRGRDYLLDLFVRELEAAAARVDRRAIVGIGVAQAGPTNSDDGTMYNPPHLPGWDGFSAKPTFERRLGLVSSHANDATAAALAEYAYGAGRGARHLLFMAIGTGIGGGIVIDGRLYTGARGFAGEVGHISIDHSGPLCPCGNRGCLEMLASGDALGRIARERLASGERSSILEFSGGELERVAGPAVADAARSGDELALSIMRDAGTHLGVGILGLLNALDVERVVLGGGVLGSMDLMMPWAIRAIEERAIVPYERGVPVVMSELGDDAGLLGAAALAFDAYDRGARAPGQ